MDELDKKIIRIMQGEFPLVAEPYKVLASQIGISEDELIERLNEYKKSGKIRKMGAVLRHREVGYSANVLCAWIVADDCVAEVSKNMASHPAVSHCYDREVVERWPYNVYTMIHGHSRGECKAIADEIATANGLAERVMLYSLKEWKKTSMRYFCEKETQ